MSIERRNVGATAAGVAGNAFTFSLVLHSLPKKLTCSSFSGFLDTAVTSAS